MEFRIADTFTDSLARLSGDEQKAVKTTAFDLQLNPANPGMSFHKLDNARDSNFWSVRVSADIRLIVHRSSGSLLLCYVDHHDRAYRWAERRKLDVHPRTGAAQFVEVRERVEEVRVPKYVEAPVSPAKPALFSSMPEQLLLGYGVPQEWIGDVQQATEDTLLDLVDHLPAEAAEALLELATGGEPKVAVLSAPQSSPFEHPDAQRRFRVVSSVEELERALSSPWDKWTIFLHPEQRQLVEKDYAGPARVSGSAGTGKTIVALHRAVHLARSNHEARVLLTTFSESLANALRAKLRRLMSSEPRLGERIDVMALDAVGLHLYKTQIGVLRLVQRPDLQGRLERAAAQAPNMRFKTPFLLGEWEEVVDAWQIATWEEYRDVRRLGRKTRLSEAQRASLWKIFESVQGELKAEGLTTLAGMFSRLASEVVGRPHAPYDHVVVDEAQDISIAQLKFLAAMDGGRSNALFFAGDLGQRIFQTPFSWKAVGVDVRGRSRSLTVNYRTSHQIRTCADRLLGDATSDVDGNVEVRKGTVSVFNGPSPSVLEFQSPEAEVEGAADWLRSVATLASEPHEIGVIVRSEAELGRATRALEAASIPYVRLDDKMQAVVGKATACTMHLAKGLEFRIVVVMACDDEVLPLQSRIEQATEESDLEEVYVTERHLLYVACTRAREQLLVSGVSPVSEFLRDLVPEKHR
jgi:superfamily I DNA/RNA helicase/mRNA-degrading endonuclease RelE of RelBE toxin-antitoxin system